MAAEKEGIPPKKLVDKYHEQIKESFEKLAISFDHYSRTTIPLHYENSQDFFIRLLRNGKVYKKIVERPYCPKCKRFLPDRFVRGKCPRCGSEGEKGDQCEACGKQLEPHELIEPYCIICKTTPIQKETEHWFFRLSEFSEPLREWIEGNKHWFANTRNFSLKWLAEGLEDRAITRDLEWGVPVPLKEAKGKVLYVWFDAPIGYITITKEWGKKTGKDWRRYWSKDSKIIHFIGKDNIPFHAIIWPAMLMAEGSYNLPYQIASNEFLNLEGRKMSTSKGWVVWVHEFLERHDADTLRYTLLASNPEKHDSDFSWKDYQARTNNELADMLGNFVHRCLSFCEKYMDGLVPPAHSISEREKELVEEINKTEKEVGELIENFRLQAALKRVMDLAQLGNRYFNEYEPWKMLKDPNKKEEAETCIHYCLNLVHSLSILCAPFMPYTAEKMWESLNLRGSVHEQPWKDIKKSGMKTRHKIKKPKILFRKIEDREIEMELEKLKKSSVKFEEFEKLDIRIGRITEAERIQKKRQIVAGIGDRYEPQELVNKHVVVVANLEPKKILGVESHGMLLAAEDGENIVLLTPEREVPGGTKVR